MSASLIRSAAQEVERASSGPTPRESPPSVARYSARSACRSSSTRAPGSVIVSARFPEHGPILAACRQYLAVIGGTKRPDLELASPLRDGNSCRPRPPLYGGRRRASPRRGCQWTALPRGKCFRGLFPATAVVARDRPAQPPEDATKPTRAARLTRAWPGGRRRDASGLRQAHQVGQTASSSFRFRAAGVIAPAPRTARIVPLLDRLAPGSAGPGLLRRSRGRPVPYELRFACVRNVLPILARIRDVGARWQQFLTQANRKAHRGTRRPRCA